MFSNYIHKSCKYSETTFNSKESNNVQYICASTDNIGKSKYVKFNKGVTKSITAPGIKELQYLSGIYVGLTSDHNGQIWTWHIDQKSESCFDTV